MFRTQTPLEQTAPLKGEEVGQVVEIGLGLGAEVGIGLGFGEKIGVAMGLG